MKKYNIVFELNDTFIAEDELEAMEQMVEQIKYMSFSELCNCMTINEEEVFGNDDR